jgi:hypothetical protein
MSQTAAGVRSPNFSNAVLFLTDVLDLDVVHYDGDREVARFTLPSGGLLELFGSNSLWQPFTNPPDWEVIIADIQDRSAQNRHIDV